MPDFKRTTLFGKLNSLAFKAADSAMTFCKMRGNPSFELVHWLHAIVQQPQGDMAILLKHYGLDSSKLAADFTTALDKLPRGASGISDFSIHFDEAIKQAWTYATLLYGDSQVRTGPRAARHDEDGTAPEHPPADFARVCEGEGGRPDR